MFDRLKTYFVGKGLDLVDSAYQRAVKNPKTSAWGVGWTAAFEGLLQTLQSQGCDLTAIRPAGAMFTAYGLWQTEKNKVIVRNGDGRLTTKTAEQLINATPADFARPDTGNN